MPTTPMAYRLWSSRSWMRCVSAFRSAIARPWRGGASPVALPVCARAETCRRRRSDGHEALADLGIMSTRPLASLVLRKDAGLARDLTPLLLLDQMLYVVEEFGVDRVCFGDVRAVGQHLKLEDGRVQYAGR